MRQLSAESALVRALNDGVPQWTTGDHLIADLWALWVNNGRKGGLKDHPRRVEMEAKAKADAKQARVIELRTEFEKRKRTYGLG